jgi:hypothetical protein
MIASRLFNAATSGLGLFMAAFHWRRIFGKAFSSSFAKTYELIDIFNPHPLSLILSCGAATLIDP